MKNAAVVGLNSNPNSTGAGVYGQTVGAGPAGLFQGNVVVNGNVSVNGNITATGDVFLPGADVAEHFNIADAEKAEPGTVMVISKTEMPPASTASAARSASSDDGARTTGTTPISSM